MVAESTSVVRTDTMISEVPTMRINLIDDIGAKEDDEERTTKCY